MPLRTLLAGMLALALFIAAPAWAISSSTVTIDNTQWYDLGVGPMYIQSAQPAMFRVDDAQPAASAVGAPIGSGQQVGVTTHVWARANGDRQSGTFPATIIVIPLLAPSQAAVSGIKLGTAGAAGSLYAGYTFSGGDDFSSNSLSIVCPTTPNGRYFTQHVYQIFGVPFNGPRAAYNGVGYAGLQGYDIDTCHTGFGDIGKGTQLSSYNDMIVQGNGYLSLKTRVAATAEIPYTNAAEPILSSMISAPGYIVGLPPFVVEARIRYNPSQVSGFHPAFWLEQSGGYNSQTGTVVGGVDTNNDFEVDHEGAASASSTSPNRYSWAGGVQTVFAATAAMGSLTWDGNWHLETFVVTATGVSWYIDGNLIRQDTVSTLPFGLRPFFPLITDHVTNGGGDGYSTAAWTTIGATGAVTQTNYLGFWRSSTGTHRIPQPQADINIAWNASWPQTVTLPSASSVWGGAVTVDNVEAIPLEAEDPGVSYANGAAWDGMPSWITASTNPDGTVKLVIQQPPRAGRIIMTRTGGNAGDTVSVQRFTIHVGPHFLTPANLVGVQGQNFRYNLATDCDTGGEAKTIAVPNMPSSGWTLGSTPGVTFGLLQETTVGASPTVLTVVCTNAVTGQSVSQSLTVGPVVAGVGAPLPTFTEGAPILSIDYDLLSSLTLNSTSIMAAAGADGTAAAATQGTQALAPTTSLVGTRNGATFNGTTQFMDLAAMITANAAAFKADHTIIVIATPTSTAGNPAIWVDVGVGAGTATAQRSDLGATTTSLLFRNGSVTADATAAGVTTSGIHNYIGRRLMGSPQDLQTNLDLGGDLPGYGSPVTSSTISSNPDKGTIGARFVASAYSGFAAAVIYKVVIYPWCLTAQELGQIKNWKVNNYGP